MIQIEAYRLTMATPTSKKVVIPHVFVCTNKACKKAGSEVVAAMFKDLAGEGVIVEESGCHGQCGNGPNLRTSPSGTLFTGVFKPATAAAILESECGRTVNDQVVASYKEKMYGDQELSSGKFLSALERLDAALSLGGLDDIPMAQSSTWLSKANALHRLAISVGPREARLKDAEAAVRKALDLNRKNKPAWMKLCDVLEAQDRIEEAIELLQTELLPGADPPTTSSLRKKLERLEGKYMALQ